MIHVVLGLDHHDQDLQRSTDYRGIVVIFRNYLDKGSVCMQSLQGFIQPCYCGPINALLPRLLGCLHPINNPYNILPARIAIV